ncbi:MULTISPECIES: aminotransferase class I/II-fold pyridoxal phosphate-dependent enzyme [Symmachiella]|uniref:Glutamate-pyruvate aminotransferase AlaC n=2 Tax=Symmachiella TaxID=2795780 RepID=A0A517ZR32_9PLAN|nr:MULTISPECIES: aminotransferase class I/II-fold pyridoxal phosphate-dependent enzyme [Symmachiella]QDT49236.1 Glutamate-pyruvate aminotransferase AlaC [Symmachiella dynata]QDU44903.1 Glutamate-pyruvate aminotransferase AlaC [Symmachiella dynata]TWU06592.1 Glutamate-pyruvate aminotransferase AlaC [Symmachiella macrocystis]
MRSESEQPESDNPFTIPVATRVLRLPPYLFGKINALKHKKRVAGVDVIDLGMGNPTDPPDPMIIEKLTEAVADPRNHRYSVSTGVENLRREVGKRYWKRYGVRIDPNDEVVACIGSKEGFSHLCLALMGPGDTAIVPAPSFPVHVYAVALASGNVIALDVRDPEQFLANIDYTCTHLYPKPKLVIVNFPHNPSATVIEQDFYVELVRLAKKHGFLVISDFAYADICFEGYQAPSFLATPGAFEVGVEFTTMSKGYSMAGWRIGFCAGNAEMCRALATIKGYYDYGIFQPVQIAAIVAMRNCDAAVESIAEEYHRRRDVLCDGLERLGWEIERPRAGMFIWAKIPEPWAQMGSIDFAMKLLDEVGVAVSPGRGFGEEGEGYLRMAIVENEQRLRQAVRQIGRCMKQEVEQP